MKLLDFTLYIITAIILASCTSYFDLDDFDAEEKLVIYTMPMAGSDTTFIQLSKSTPVTGSQYPPDGIPGAKIDFSVNGELQPVCWTENRLGKIPAKSYYVVKTLNEGDKIDIVAEAAGLPPVSSSSVVPSRFILSKIVLDETDSEFGKMRQFRITFKDDPSTDDYYGIRILHKMKFHSYSIDFATGDTIMHTETITEFSNLDLSQEPLLNNKVGLDATFDFDYFYYENLYIWSDDQIQGKDYTLRLNTNLERNNPSDDEGQTERPYKVCLYRLSPELYNFLKSLNDISNNELGQNGLAPIRSHYTNIANGFGVLGAGNLIETDWLENPDEGETLTWQPADSHEFLR